MVIAITGASRGIGLELVRQWAARGAKVLAAAREPLQATELQALAKRLPERVHVHRCDVTGEADVAAFARAYEGVPVDVLVNNAGVMGSREPLARVDLADVSKTFEANAVGPLRVTRALLPNLRIGSRKLVLHLSSKMASISDNGSGGYYAYRMSKVALNMMSKSLAVDLEPEGISSVVVHPGWVQTSMGGPHAPVSVEASAAALIELATTLDRSASGSFIDWTGRPIPW